MTNEVLEAIKAMAVADETAEFYQRKGLAFLNTLNAPVVPKVQSHNACSSIIPPRPPPSLPISAASSSESSSPREKVELPVSEPQLDNLSNLLETLRDSQNKVKRATTEEKCQEIIEEIRLALRRFQRQYAP